MADPGSGATAFAHASLVMPPRSTGDFADGTLNTNRGIAVFRLAISVRSARHSRRPAAALCPVHLVVSVGCDRVLRTEPAEAHSMQISLAMPGRASLG